MASRRLLALLLVVLTTACGTRFREAAPSVSPNVSNPSPSGSSVPSASSTPSPTPFPIGGPVPTSSPTTSAPPSPTTPAVPGRSPSPAPPATGAVRLVGWWQVTVPAGVGHLGLDDDLVVVHRCGKTVGAWGASPSGLFLALPSGGDSSCYQQPPRPDVRWLDQARTYLLRGGQLELRAYDGRVVARATRAQPPRGQQPRRASDPLRQRLGRPAPLPAGLEPVTAASLVRRWQPRGDDAGNGKGYVSFARSAVWTGSDGCNSVGGSYALGARGEVLTASHPSTQVGCDATPAPGWVARARSLGLKDGVLHLFDAGAVLLGRLHPV